MPTHIYNLHFLTFKYYLNCLTNYAYDEISILYDNYIEDVVSSNSEKINEYIISKYENPTNVDINYNIHDKVSEILYDRFYNQAQDAIANHYESY